MDDERWPNGRNELEDLRTVADVEVDVLVIAQLATELLAAPSRIALRSEEVRAHVVVDAVNAVEISRQRRGDLGPDQPGCAGHEQNPVHAFPSAFPETLLQNAASRPQLMDDWVVCCPR